MTFRIWLKKTVEQSLENEQGQKCNAEEDGASYFNGVVVETNKASGERFITIYADPLNPTASMPRIDHKHVKRVSWSDKYFEGFRTDGIYRYKGATARVETIKDTDGVGETLFERHYQEISISASSIRTLRVIYTKVRTGELKVEQDWGAYQHQVEARKHAAEVAAKTAEAAEQPASTH